MPSGPGPTPGRSSRPRHTLGAVAAAGQLPDQLGQALLVAARQAFTQGLHLAFASSTAVAISTAIVAAALMRHVRPSSEPEEQPPRARADRVAARRRRDVVQGRTADARAGS